MSKNKKTLAEGQQEVLRIANECPDEDLTKYDYVAHGHWSPSFVAQARRGALAEQIEYLLDSVKVGPEFGNPIIAGAIAELDQVISKADKPLSLKDIVTQGGWSPEFRDLAHRNALANRVEDVIKSIKITGQDVGAFGHYRVCVTEDGHDTLLNCWKPWEMMTDTQKANAMRVLAEETKEGIMEKVAMLTLIAESSDEFKKEAEAHIAKAADDKRNRSE